MNRSHSSILLLLIILASISFGGCFNAANPDTEILIEYVEGEVFVRLENQRTFAQLEAMAERLELSINRSLGNGYILNVPETFEPIWIIRLEQDPIIDQAQLNRFGYNYQINETETLPFVRDDSLFVEVSYSGCESEQVFSLEAAGNFSTIQEIWLFKITPDQDCDAFFTEERGFYIPRIAQLATQVFLIDPYGTAIELWPAEEDED